MWFCPRTPVACDYLSTISFPHLLLIPFWGNVSNRHKLLIDSKDFKLEDGSFCTWSLCMTSQPSWWLMRILWRATTAVAWGLLFLPPPPLMCVVKFLFPGVSFSGVKLVVIIVGLMVCQKCACYVLTAVSGRPKRFGKCFRVGVTQNLSFTLWGLGWYSTTVNELLINV